MLAEWIRRRLEELREGLEELQTQAREAEARERVGEPGRRRQAPVYIPAGHERYPPTELPSNGSSDRSGEPIGLDLSALDEVAVEPTVDVRQRRRSSLRRRLRDPSVMREAVMLREILDRPLGLRRPARRSFRDR